jgi:ferredoxin
MAADPLLLQAREAALAAARAHAPEPTSLVDYTSRGACLVAGATEVAIPAARALAERLKVQVLAEGTAPAEATGLEVLTGKLTGVEGHLGAFRVEARAPNGETVDLSPLCPNPDGHFDLVLDLGSPPVLERELPPPGYYAPGDDPHALAAALDELPTLVGDFDKPTYFAYDPNICAHGRSGLTGCTRCLDACPAEAITSIGERIQVDPHLCQGGGACAAVCPSGAIRYAYPGPGDTLERVRTLLRAFREAGGAKARLLIHDVEHGADLVASLGEELPPAVLPLSVEEVASVGLEVWLSALAYGAAQVVIAASADTPRRSLLALTAQVDVARTLLAGMGHGADRLRLLAGCDAETLAAAFAEPAAQALAPATYAALEEKRTVAFLAIDHLYAQAPVHRPFIDLPTGAPFGTAQVSEERCTLCMACVSVCPGKALQDGGDHPRLRFIEGNCLQCGMCTRACPEDAIWISPRLLYERERRNQAQVLYEEEPFRCTRCGKPFSTRSMVERMTERLREHPMFQGAALARLTMCEDCRVRAMAESEDGEAYFSMGRGA